MIKTALLLNISGTERWRQVQPRVGVDVVQLYLPLLCLISQCFKTEKFHTKSGLLPTPEKWKDQHSSSCEKASITQRCLQKRTAGSTEKASAVGSGEGWMASADIFLSLTPAVARRRVSLWLWPSGILKDKTSVRGRLIPPWLHSTPQALGLTGATHTAGGWALPSGGGDRYPICVFQAQMPSRVQRKWVAWNGAPWLCRVAMIQSGRPTGSGGVEELLGVAARSLFKPLDQSGRWGRAVCPSRTVRETSRSPWPWRSSGWTMQTPTGVESREPEWILGLLLKWPSAQVRVCVSVAVSVQGLFCPGPWGPSPVT